MRVEFTRVSRAQPKAPQGGFEQRTKALDGVDAGLSDERHDEYRTGQYGEVGSRSRASATACGDRARWWGVRDWGWVEGGGRSSRCSTRLRESPERTIRRGRTSHVSHDLRPCRRSLRRGAVSFQAVASPF